MSQNGEPKIRGAVVGAGHMGQYHILALAEIWNVELVGVVDVDFDRAQRVAAPYGAKPMNHECDGAPVTSAVPVFPAMGTGTVLTLRPVPSRTTSRM